jgi:hypothetical protein
MALGSKLLRQLGRRATDKLMDKVGGRLVSGMADTSSDAPNAFHKPKRDVYRHMRDGTSPEAPEAPEAPAEEPEQAHDHDHGHDHGRRS